MFIIGLALVSFSTPIIISIISVFMKLEQSSRYRLTGGITEEDLLLGLIFTLLAFGIGVALMIFAWMKKRNEDTLKTILNQTNGNFCTYCGVNVAGNNVRCPICQRDLRRNHYGSNYR